jgi:EGF-like domain
VISFCAFACDAQTLQAWDSEMIYGCVCDSSWPVGLGPGQVQEAEWFGPDCSLRHCPSGNDPTTVKNETDCSNRRQITEDGVYNKRNGSAGNICHVDCSNRGICDYKTGTCTCFTGFSGLACNIAPHQYNMPVEMVVATDDGIFSHLPLDVSYRE